MLARFNAAGKGREGQATLESPRRWRVRSRCLRSLALAWACSEGGWTPSRHNRVGLQGSPFPRLPRLAAPTPVAARKGKGEWTNLAATYARS
jgi:hypothetical protein